MRKDFHSKIILEIQLYWLMSKHGGVFTKPALTFSQEVLKEPPGVVLWVLQMDVGSPPGGRGEV